MGMRHLSNRAKVRGVGLWIVAHSVMPVDVKPFAATRDATFRLLNAYEPVDGLLTTVSGCIDRRAWDASNKSSFTRHRMNSKVLAACHCQLRSR